MIHLSMYQLTTLEIMLRKQIIGRLKRCDRVDVRLVPGIISNPSLLVVFLTSDYVKI